MHPAQINAFTILINQMIQNAQTTLQLCASLKQMVGGAGVAAQAPNVLGGPQADQYLNSQEEAYLQQNIQQARQAALAETQDGQYQAETYDPAFQNEAYNPQAARAFDQMAAGLIPHHPGAKQRSRMQNPRPNPQGSPPPFSQPVQQQQRRAPIPQQPPLGGGLADFDPMMGLGDFMVGG